jgi:uncharacterized protein (UPF0261 family)
MAVVLIGTLDTKGRELGFARDLIRAQGLETIVVDAGSREPPAIAPDIDRDEVFRRAGSSSEAIRLQADRGEAVARAAEGVSVLIGELDRAGRVDGVLGIGGSAGTVIASAAMRALPFGRPKVLLSTLASGQTRPYVGGSDIALFHSVADIAGLNRLTRVVLANAAHALVGMVKHPAPGLEPGDDRPIVAATMFGVTTPCVDRARRKLEAAGCEVLVFHATGVGGRAMEGLIRDGLVDAVLDLTTTELADELVGGILSAGPDRLEAAGRKGVPQVVSLGALDMVNFGPMGTIPDRFAHRKFHVHNPSVTLMRTTPDENAALGAWIGAILGRATGPVTLLIPLAGISALDALGQPFYDPQADAALIGSLRQALRDKPNVRIIERDAHLNDPDFANLAAGQILEDLRALNRLRDPA